MSIEELQARVDAAQASYDQALLMLWGLIAFELAFVAGVAAHELGHAILARRGGLPVRMIRIGTGWPVLRWRLGRTWLVVRIIPFSGGVLALAPQPPSRAAATAFLMGGIAANVLLIAAAALVHLSRPVDDWWSMPAGTAQLALIVGSAVPHSWRTRHGPGRSDGERLRSLWRGDSFWSGSEAQAQSARRLALAVPLPEPSAAWSEIAYQITRPERAWEAWARRDASAALRSVLDDPDLTWFERLVVLDDLVIQETVHGLGLVTEAELDAWSGEALGRAATPPVRVARAGALCRLGRWTEAEDILGSEADRVSGTRRVQARLFAARLLVGRARAELGQARPES